MPRRRVVITGLGPMTGLGMGIDPLWSAMLEGRSAVRRIGLFDPSGFPCRFAAEVDSAEFDIRKIVPKNYRKYVKVMARDIELAVTAALSAVDDAGLTTKGTNPDTAPTYPPARVGCHIGAGLIAADADELTASMYTSARETGSFDIAHWGREGMFDLTPLWMLKYLPNMLACHVTIIHDCQGPSNTITCAEASAILSLGESMRVIEREAADVCLTGGAESKLNTMGMLRQGYAGRLAETRDDEDPAAVIRPFAPDARGALLGEGGGILIVEAHDTAVKRSAKIYAEVAGFGSTQSFCPDTVGLEIAEDDRSIDEAMQQALADASLAPEEIDAIVPFGSGIAHIDRAEQTAISRVFCSRTPTIPIITTVPNAGNCCAGASAVSMIVAAKALSEQMLPARLNTTGAEHLDANATESRPAELNHVLVLNCSMGGQNAAAVLRRYGEVS